MKLKSFLHFPKNVYLLSLVSLFNDIAGETIRRLFPLFLSNILGVKTTIIGLIEGVGQATPHLIEPVSGYLSDKTNKRKVFILLGQILRSSMIFLLFTTTWPQALLVRFLDRSGKGISDSPRDALISKSSGRDKQGKAFGLSRAMDNLGATIGMALVILILIFYGNPSVLNHSLFRLVLLFVVAPPLLTSILIILLGVSEKDENNQHYYFHDHLGKEFYIFLFLNFLFSLGNFSDGFLILKAQNIGIPLFGIFLLLGIFTFSSTLVALPAGNYSDHHNRKRILGFGWLVFAASYLGFAQASTFWQLVPLFVIYGIFYGSTQGVSKAIISDLIPSSKEALAFGLYNMVIGLALFPASLLAGFLWQRFDPSAAFYTGSAFSLLAAYGLFHKLPSPKKHWWEIWKE